MSKPSAGSRAPGLIGTATITAVMAVISGLAIWAIEGLHDAQVVQGQHLAALSASLEGFSRQMERIISGVDQMRSQQIDEGDLRRLEADFSRHIQEQGAKLQDVDRRLQVIERKDSK